MWEDIINIPNINNCLDINSINNLLKKDQYIIIGCSDNWSDNISKLNLNNIFEYENSKTILFERA
ncbi:MAG: hypothetical protein PHS24_02695 [Bacilli bacterium]|nr:hypothetical protein [Bacilli bacterium]